VREVSQGLRVMPVSGPWVMPFQPNSGVVVLQKNCAGLAQARDAGRILGTWRYGGCVRADARRPARDMRRILDRNGHAVERPERRAAAPAFRRLRGHPPALRFIQQADGIENRIDRVQTCQRGVQHISGDSLPSAKRRTIPRADSQFKSSDMRANYLKLSSRYVW
jgi:hypothetical protein